MKTEVNLTCWSKSMTLEEVNAWTGVKPSFGHNRGDRNSLGKKRKYTRWCQVSEIRSLRRVQSEIADHLRHWNKCLAGRKRPRGLEAIIEVVMYFDEFAAGFTLDPSVMRLMADSDVKCEVVVYRCTPSTAKPRKRKRAK